MKKLIHIQNQTGEYIIRTEQLNGQDHWVVPVVMIVEGVHEGSQGPVLYYAEELQNSADAWNNIPVVINHPQRNQELIPIGDDLDETVGILRNAHMEGTKLKAEAWIDVSALQSTSQEAYERIRDERVLEVSIGALAKFDIKNGEFNNEQYRAIARHLVPDHLALLPDTVGACSHDDGCGVRNKQNKKGGNNVEDLKKPSLQEMLDLGIGAELIANETGFREIMTNLQQKLDQLDNNMRVHFLEEVFEDDFVYRIVNRESGETQFFKRDYVVQEDSSIEFDSDPVEVRKETTFQALIKGRLNKEFKSVNKKEERMENKGTPCKVDALIANEGTRFTEENKEWLSTLEDSVLDTLIPPEKKKPEVAAVVDNTKSVTASSSKGDHGKIDPEELKKNVREILLENKNPETFIDNYFPEEMREQMKAGNRMYQEKKVKLIEGIVANSKFEKEALANWKDEDLQNLYDSVTPKGDYSVLAVDRDGKLDSDVEVETMIIDNSIWENFGKEKEVKNG